MLLLDRPKLLKNKSILLLLKLDIVSAMLCRRLKLRLISVQPSSSARPARILRLISVQESSLSGPARPARILRLELASTRLLNDALSILSLLQGAGEAPSGWWERLPP